MPHNREIIPVVVLNHGLVRDHIASIHRAGCADIAKDAKDHGSTIHGPYDSVDLALADFIDSEMEEMGYSDDDVKVYLCCRQRSATSTTKEATMPATTTRTRKSNRPARAKSATRKTSTSRVKTDKALSESLVRAISALGVEMKAGRHWHSVRKDGKLVGYVKLTGKLAVSVRVVDSRDWTNFEVAGAADIKGAVAELKSRMPGKVKAPAKTLAEPLDS